MTTGMCAIFYAPREFLDAAYSALASADETEPEDEVGADAVDAVQDGNDREV